VSAAGFAFLFWKLYLTPEAPQVPKADTVQATPVRAAPVIRGLLQLSSQYPGELDADTSDLASKISGRLNTVEVRIGDRLTGGDIVAVVDDTDLQNQLKVAQVQVEVVEANSQRVVARLRVAEGELERMERLFRELLISAQQIESNRSSVGALKAELKAMAAQKRQAEARVNLLSQQIQETKVRAPFTGTVGERYLDPGTFVQPGTPIIRLVKSGPLRIRFWVPEGQLSLVELGLSFQLTTQITGSRTFTGTVKRLSGEVNRSNRTVAVEGVMGESTLSLRPGMYAQVRVAGGTIEGTIVPGAAVLKRVNTRGVEAQGVFIAAEDAARWIPVELLGRQDDRVAVKGDLAAGDLVLVFGHQDLADGARVTVATFGSD
jgi:membrane fusion protein (multidrug efflux system)